MKTRKRKKGYHDVYSEKLKTDRDDVSVENMADNEVSDVIEHTNRAVGREMEEEEEVVCSMTSLTSLSAIFSTDMSSRSVFNFSL